MRTLAYWRDAGFDQLPVGGKARALAALSRAGFSVPEWCVVLPDSGGCDLSDTAAREVGGFLAERMQAHGPWAVRSSALDEDGAKHSFAGQLDSYLNVDFSGISRRIADVRRSGFGGRVVFYRTQAGLPLPPPMPAVIVQSMVPAIAAGVAFSADPVSGRRGVAVVSSVRGLGDALVSGEAPGDTFEVARDGTILRRIAAGEESGFSLSDAQVIQVAGLARRAAGFFGCPQDIEWALSETTLFLLQSRPVTSLAALADPDGAFQLWDNSNIAESYNGVTTPLTFSFARHVYEEVYRQFVRILRVPRWRIEAGRDTFSRMLGLVRGRVYYNLLSWYRVLAMLPGFAVNRRFMEQMMGVKEGLPEEIVAGMAGAKHKAGLRDYLEIANTAAGLVWNQFALPGKRRAFYQRLDEALASGDVALEDMRPDELACAYRKLESDLLTRWDAPLINDFFAMIYFGVLRKLVQSWCGDARGTLQNDLVSCQGGIISAEPARRVKRMASLARPHGELAKALCEAELSDMEAMLPAYPGFYSEYRGYLEKFGDRCLEELKLESLTLRDDPLLLLRSIGRLAVMPEIPERAAADGLVREAEAGAFGSLKSHPLRRGIFRFVLNQTRDRVRDRENLRFERTRVFGRVRRIFVEIGRRLHALDRLEAPKDIFFLTIGEALGFIEGTAVGTRLKELVQLRREEFDGYREGEPPADRFESRGSVYVGHSFAGKTSGTVPGGYSSSGIGCCPGIARGRVRVILDPRNAEILPGEILVAPRTDPGWILLFPAAAALVVEHGSLLSHSAIVAREMGLPAVVALPGATSWLATGDLIEVDGATGQVRKLNPAHD